MPQLIGTGFFTVTDVNDGAGGLNIVLSNSSHNIPTDSAGANGNYAGAVTTVSIYSGTTDISAQYSVTATPSSGVTGSLATRTYTVTGITVDAGYVDLTATRAGFPTLAARFSLVRAKAGAAGATGQRSATISLYRWSAAAPTTYPSGSSTYTWATGTFTAPATLNGWSLVPPAAVAGQTLWGIDALVTDTAVTATTAVTWSSTAPYPAGSAGSNGNNGPRGAGLYRASSATGLWPDGDATANALAASACPGGAVVGDAVTIYKATDVTVAVTKQYTGSAWTIPALTVHGGMIVDGGITARTLAAGAVSADKLNVSSLINSAGVYTSFKIQPASNQPLWLGNTDSAGNNPVPIFYIDRAGLGYFKGGLGADTVDSDAIKQAAKTQINPYFLGAQAGSKQENTTSASMDSLATVSLPAVTVIGGIVNVSAALAANSSNFSTNRLGAVNPQWQVEIFRTSTAGTRVFNQTFTGTSWSLYDSEAGSPSFGFWDESESISINIAFTDSSAPASTVYVMRVTKIAGVMVTSLNRSYFGANSPSYVTNTLQKAANGYFKDKETGFILQWGTISLAANAVSTITLPIAFPALCTFASANQLENNAAADPSLVYAKGLTTISLINGSNTTQTVLWQAMGY